MKKTIKKIISNTLIAASIMLYGLPAFAEMPQTDVDFINQMAGNDADKIIALEEYYKLHVSELEVQLITEQNTGAFLGSKRAEREGDVGEAKRLNDMYESTKATKEKITAENRQLRKHLSEISKIEFPSNLVMAPDAPETIPTVPADTSIEMKENLAAAWKYVTLTRKNWNYARLDLLDGQEKYNNGEKNIHIGDLMRAVTNAEMALARSAADLRLVVAKIAVAGGQPLAAALSGL
ncbi:MAG: hypothetical protein OEW37_08670 [Rhodospirillaceae bacterium]|nr:hypothetical protein [Rhodospirillaceae bacterium]